MSKMLLILLCAIPFSVNADWTYVSKNQSGNTFYIDDSAIEKAGNKRKVWMMLDLENPFNNAIYSFKRQMEFDCSTQTVKGLYVIGFSQNLSKGQVMMNGPIKSHPTPISPSSIEKDFFDRVCK